MPHNITLDYFNWGGEAPGETELASFVKEINEGLAILPETVDVSYASIVDTVRQELEDFMNAYPATGPNFGAGQDWQAGDDLPGFDAEDFDAGGVYLSCSEWWETSWGGLEMERGAFVCGGAIKGSHPRWLSSGNIPHVPGTGGVGNIAASFRPPINPNAYLTDAIAGVPDWSATVWNAALLPPRG